MMHGQKPKLLFIILTFALIILAACGIANSQSALEPKQDISLPVIDTSSTVNTAAQLPQNNTQTITK